MNKTGSLILLLITQNIATSQIITIPIEKRVPEVESNSFLDDSEQAAIDQLINHSQFMYSGKIEVDNSKQTLNLDFDTGSNLLWLTSKSCETFAKDGFKNSYNCQVADGCNMTATPGSVSYVDGSGVFGHIAQVPVGIAGLAPSTQALLLVDKSIKKQRIISTSLLVMRNDIFKQWIKYLKSVANIKTIMSGLSVFYSVKCGTTLPDLTFTLTDFNGVDRNYTLPSSFYLINQGNICLIGVQDRSVTSEVQFLLGNVFMRRFVSVFDDSTLSMGLSESVANPAKAPNKIQKHSADRAIVLGLALIAIAGLIFLTIRALRK
ncbi:hypothetical protein ABPG72_019067 [Tetrahymena utriculariae]